MEGANLLPIDIEVFTEIWCFGMLLLGCDFKNTAAKQAEIWRGQAKLWEVL